MQLNTSLRWKGEITFISNLIKDLSKDIEEK